MKITINSPTIQDKEYCFKWDKSKKRVWVVFNLKDKTENLFQIGENALSIEDVTQIAERYLKINEDFILDKENRFKREGLL